VCVCVYLLLRWPRAGLDQPRRPMGLASRRLVRILVASDTVTSGECCEDWFVLVCVFPSAGVEYHCTGVLISP